MLSRYRILDAAEGRSVCSFIGEVRLTRVSDVIVTVLSSWLVAGFLVGLFFGKVVRGSDA